MKRLFSTVPDYEPNVVVDSAFASARHEFSNVVKPNSSALLSVTSSVRNNSDPGVQVLCAGFLPDEYRTYTRFNPVTEKFECISAFVHAHNRNKHTVIRFTNAAKPA